MLHFALVPPCAGPRARCAPLGNAPHPSRPERSGTRANVAQRPQCPRAVTPNPASRKCALDGARERAQYCPWPPLLADIYLMSVAGLPQFRQEHTVLCYRLTGGE
jgi:hypothetical protein